MPAVGIRVNDIQFFLIGDVLVNGSSADFDGTLKLSRGRIIVVQGDRHQRNYAIRIEKSCALIHRLPLQTFIPSFPSFLCIVRN